jgi:hypothetical protein
MRIVDDKLSALWHGAWLPVSQKNKNKPLAASTLQSRYKESFVRALHLNPQTRKKKAGKKAEVNALPVLPFNQFRFDKDFIESTQTFFNDESVRTPDLELRLLPNTVGTYLMSYELIVPAGHADLIVFFDEFKPMIYAKLVSKLRDLGGLKYSLGLEVVLRKGGLNGTPPVFTDPPARFYSVHKAATLEADLRPEEAVAGILESLESFVQNGSGWVVDSIQTLWLNIAKYQPLKGGSYLELPRSLKLKRAVINVKNKNDDNCLRYALRSALFPAKHNTELISSYPKDDGLNFKGIDAPTPISQIAKIEKLNKLAINVYGYEKGVVIIHRISDQPHEIPRINTMIIEKDEPEGIRTHYVWVKHLNRLLASQNKSNNQTFFCERCLHGYSRKDLLDQHMPECRGVNERAIKIVLPAEGKNSLHFTNFKKQLKAPWVMYADFEANTTKIEGPQKSANESYTHRTQLHEACGFALRAVRSDGMTIGPVVYRGPDAVKRFLVEAKKFEKAIIEMLKNREKSIYLTDEEKTEHAKADTCWICKKGSFKNNAQKVCLLQEAVCFACAQKVTKRRMPPLEYAKDFEAFKTTPNCKICDCAFSDDYKVRDHDHITGKYRGAAHANCNLKLRINPDKIEIPVFFHNLRGYDSHLIMQQIGEMEGEIKCIPNNMEKYISFSLGQLVFKDSAQFLLASLGKLVESNKRKVFKFTGMDRSEEEFGLLLRKGVYPYDYMDGWDKFDETALPPIETFYSTLIGEGISRIDYAHALNVWKVFGCETMGDYHDLYLRTDVDLLADVFEHFRSICMDTYELDPANYYTSPGLSWDALLKKTNANLELLTDYDMHLMIEKGLRGGISMVSQRFAKANNPSVESHDLADKTSYITYLDANNLYGWAMVQHLPTSGFKWADVSIEQALSHAADSETGYILEVDMTYPDELHDAHNDYPLAPEKLEVQQEWLSAYQNEILGDANLKIKKLVPNLRAKCKYVVHYRNLQLYAQLGMKVEKIHRALEFKQSPWMAPYIQMNTELRKKSGI